MRRRAVRTASPSCSSPDVANAQPRRDADCPERLGHPHVADPGNEALIQERLAEPELPRTAQPGDDRVDVELLAEHVLPQPPDVPDSSVSTGPFQSTPS